MTPKEKMQRAKELIQQKKYAEARKILKTVDHPTAEKWLAQIDKMAPAKRQPSSGGGYLIIGGVVIVIILFVVVAFVVFNQQQLAIGDLPTAVIIPTNTITNTPLPSDTPTRTLYPTFTPSLTVTPSPTITQTPTQNGTLVAMQTGNAIGIQQAQNTQAALTATGIFNIVVSTQVALTQIAQPLATLPLAGQPIAGAVPRDEAGFIAYIRQKYGSIEGFTLDIEDIIVFNEPSLHSVGIELTRESALYTFSDRTEVAAQAYVELLLEDAIAYFGEQDIIVSVDDIYYSDSLEDYMFDDEWYYIGDYSTSQDGWYINRTYVAGYYLEGRRAYKVWNYK